VAESVEVKVAEDKLHGSLATVTVKPAVGVSRQEIENKVDDILGHYTVRYIVQIQ